MSLSSQQIRHLRSLAHHLKPVVWIGQHGIRDNVLQELEIALDSHELIKVKIAAEKAERQQILTQLLEQSGAEFVQHIGQMGVLFRRNTKKPKVVLPR